MDNNTIELIKTIGSQWKFLLVVFFIIIFIVKWKTIWSSVSSFTQVRVKRGQTEFELHRKEKKEENKTINKEKEKSKGESLEDDNEEIPEIKKENNLHILYHEALSERKFNEAKDFFDKILKAETNSKKRKEEIIRNYYWRHSYGDTSAFTELENHTLDIENDNEQKSVGLYYLSLIYKEANNYKKAIELANKALEISTDNEQKSYFISKISEFHLDNDNNKEALDIIINNIDSINDKEPKTTLYRALANYYKKTDNKLLESVAYQKALELSPNNTYLLFDSAYNYSETEDNLEDLGFLLYKKLLSFNSKDQSALNNIGVSYKNLGLGIKSIEQYKKSFELKNSLAASNIGYSLIHLGFIKEAEEYLNKAEEFENPHENVFKAVSSIKSKIKEEKELEEKILKKANRKYRFFNHFGNAIFTSNKVKIKNSNKWHLNKTPIIITQNDNSIEISWEIGEEKHSISGMLTNNSIIATYKKPKKNMYSYNEQNKYIHRDIKGFGYLNSSQEMTFIFEFEKDIIELNFIEK